MMFLLGSLCFRQNVFASKPKSKKLYIVANSTAWIPINIYILFLLIPFFKPGSFLISPVVDRLIVWLAFHLSLLCLLYLSIETFRRYLDKPGRIWNELNRNSYYVYIIHVIVIGAIALPLLNSAMPSFLKHLVVTVSTFMVCNLIIYFWGQYTEKGCLSLIKSRHNKSGIGKNAQYPRSTGNRVPNRCEF